MPTQLELTIVFVSDWHAGSGSGRPGDVDRLVRRDSDGLPFVPARTLLGMWRDAAETLALALDGGQTGPWSAWVEHLFGSQPASPDERDRTGVPAPGRIRLESARLSREIIDVCRRCPRFALACTTVAPSVSIDERTGAARDDHLFLTEYALAGAELCASAILDVAPEHEAFARTFATVAAEGIASMGGDRRRGYGQCQVRVGEGDDATRAFFACLPDVPDIARAAVVGGRRPDLLGPSALGDPTPDQGFRAWSLTMDLQEPVLVHRRTLANLVETLLWIPGTLLLPLIARRLAAAGVDVFGALGRGDLLVRDARLVVDGQRGEPAPLLIHREKGGDRIWIGRPVDPTVQVKQVRGRLVAPTAGPAVVLGTVPTVVETHNVIQDDVQRPTEQVGGVYTFQGIAAGAILEARVLARRGSAAEGALDATLGGLAAAPQRLGMGRRAEYGTVTIQPRDAVLEVPEARGCELVLWLTSPLLLRGPTLLPTTDPGAVEAELGRALGITATFAPERSAVRAHRLESWHNGWELPRPSLVGLAPGSVLTFALSAPPDLSALERLQCQGLGERTAEGYGEVRVNPALIAWGREMVARDAARLPRERPDRPPGPDDFRALRQSEFGKVVMLRAARRDLARAVDAGPLAVSDDDLTRSQVGNLRSLMAGRGGAAWRNDLVAFANRQLERDGPGERQRELSGGYRKLLEWLREVASPGVAMGDPASALWKTLGEPVSWFDRELREAMFDKSLQALLVSWAQLRLRKEG